MINVFEEIAKDIVTVIRQVMASRQGVNEKVGKNTLVDSDIYKDLKYVTSSNGMIDIFINDYITYIESGRRPFTKKVPFNVLLDWARKKGLPHDNNSIYKYMYSIYWYGIKARPIMSYVWDIVDKNWDYLYTDKIFEKLTENLDKYFNN